METTGSTSLRRTVRVGAHSAPKELDLWDLEQSVPSGRVPRISRLMRCAVLINQKIRDGEYENQAEFARKHFVSPNRITQILNLLLLAPDIAEEIMFLPLVHRGPDPIKERMIRPLTHERLWSKQRQMWSDLKNRKSIVG